MTQTTIIDVSPQHGAGIEVPVRWADLGLTIRPVFDRIYKPGALAPGHGHNFILYANETTEGASMVAGVLDRIPGGADAEVKPVTIPGGRAITATHWGDYASMRSTYDALHAEVKAKGLKRIGMSLEVYGDMYDDPAKVKTDLYLYLAMAI